MPNPNIINIIDHPSIIRSTSVRLAEGRRPTRIVLRHFPDEQKFVTHYEVMTVEVRTVQRDGRMYDDVILASEGFDNGTYFEYGPGWHRTEEDAMEAAKKNFYERAARLG